MNRNKSNFIGLRRKHNHVKELLILNTIKKFHRDVEVFDVSVGRFGDLHKYIKGKVKYVFGIDPCRDSIIEAEQRLAKTDLNADLMVDCITNEELKCEKRVFDIVVCNFTLHYFFESEKMLENAMRNISNSLKTWGYFIGTSVNGEKIKPVKTKYYEIVFPDENDKRKYYFHLFDTIGTGLYPMKDIEYLVDQRVLVDMAKKYNLKLLFIKNFDNFYNLKDYEKEVSSMYFKFVFQKVKNEI
jgi:ubiquinone/menaquinone biosynthesis C-methylase UbiE